MANLGDAASNAELAVEAGGTGAATLTDGGILLGSGTDPITAMDALADGSIVIGDGTTDPVTLAAFTSSTGTLKHESGGIEADISAIADGGILVGTGAGTIAIRAGFLTAGAAGFITHELGGLEADVSGYTGLVQISGGSTSARTIGITDDDILEVDGSPNDDEYARFTANGIEGRTAGEAKTDLSFITDLVDDTSPQLGGNLDLNDYNIEVKVEPSSDDSASGIIWKDATVDTNAEGIGAPLYMAADGNFDTADADASTTAPCVALALETGTGTKDVLLFGVMRNDGWNWTKGPGETGLIYVDTTVGTLSQTQPSGTDDVVQPVGYALTDDAMFFCPSMLYFTHT